VTEISEKVVLEAQGGFTSSGSYSSSYMSSSSYVKYPSRQVESCANAYMLMYRKVTAVDKEVQHVQFPSDELVPEYIREEVKKISEEAEKKHKANEIRMNKLNVSVHWKLKKYDIATTKSSSYRDFLQQVWSKLPILEDEKELFEHMEDKEKVPVDNIRLRVYNTYHNAAGLPYDVEKSGDKTLAAMKITLNRELFIEVKSQEEEWEAYEVDGITILMTEFDAAAKEFKTVHKAIRLPKKATVGAWCGVTAVM
jgi:hypothetical protein